MYNFYSKYSQLIVESNKVSCINVHSININYYMYMCNCTLIINSLRII